MKLLFVFLSLTASMPARAETYQTGFVQTPAGIEFENKAPRISYSGDRYNVPGSYSLRGRTNAIENQAQCGSCWDFALTTGLRGTLTLAGKDPGRLSFNYLLNCAAEQAACGGGDFSAADHLIDPRGAPRYGTDGAYTAKAGHCQAEPVAGKATRYHMLGERGGEASFQDVAHVISVLKKPVVTTVYASNSWYSYGGGLMSACNTSHEVDHMVVIEGYSCGAAVDAKGNCVFDSHGNLPAGQGQWLIRNSWGSSWGDKGWATLKATDSQGRKCNRLAATALYFDVE